MMINFTEETDSQLWNVISSSMVQLPPLDSKVLYFPQGHLEHSGILDLSNCPRIRAYIRCRLAGITVLTDYETDEVFQKIRLDPIKRNELDLDLGSDLGIGVEEQENGTIFSKTLSQSDVDNCGEFSVSRLCAETIFPRLDHSSDHPFQTIFAKDIRGEVWKFRHVFRGTPKRHLLTTGWGRFMDRKKLAAGDKILFLRAKNGSICVWIRRCTKDGRRREEGEDVIKAMNLAASGKAFDVVFRAGVSSPAFIVKASLVNPALQIHWWPGMRVNYDSSDISSFTGTISSVEAADPVRWPRSPWRLLQVRWDEPDLLQNMTRVNPWLVELASDTPKFHLLSFSPPPYKKLIDGQVRYFVGLSNPFNAPAGVQGARRGENRMCVLAFGNPGQQSRNLDNEKTSNDADEQSLGEGSSDT